MRDIGLVADLLEIAFRNELDAHSRRMIREARAIGRSGPLALLYPLIFGGGLGFSPGLVWEQDGRIVGNVTILRPRGQPDLWQVANVAVHPDLRRQGIATGLMKAAIEHVRRRNGRSVSLLVREGSPAIQLYQRLRFALLGATIHWDLSGSAQVNRIKTNRSPVRRARGGDSQALWTLFKSVTPAARGWPSPLQESHFQAGLLGWLSHAAGGRSVRRWVVPHPDEQGLLGYVEYLTLLGSVPRMTLRTSPDGVGQVEGDLLAHLLKHHVRSGGFSAVMEHPAGDLLVEKHLQEAGFRPVRTLHLMTLDLSGPATPVSSTR